MSFEDSNSLERFLQEASERLQYVREYAAVPIEPQSTRDDLTRLYEAAHGLAEAATAHGFPLFAEIAGKLAHLFQYARNAELNPDTYGPLTEFIADAVTVLEFDLLQIASDSQETAGDVLAFKHRYSFAFAETDPSRQLAVTAVPAARQATHVADAADAETLAWQLPEDGELPKEVFDFFVPEAEEHFQIATECLLAMEAAPNSDDVHRLFRSVHTIKGSASQVGLQRLGVVAHRLEDLIGQVRDGALAPSAEIVNTCLRTLDVLRKFLHRDWASDEGMRSVVGPLLARIAGSAPGLEMEDQESFASATASDLADSAQPPQNAAAPGAGDGASLGKRGAQAKSVRISLQWLDELMNGVGELVINRTRLVGRVAELRKLLEVLSLSRERLTGKIAEFQDKYEFNRISTLLPGNGGGPLWHSGKTGKASKDGSWAVPEFSELELDRYDDFNILSRSLTEISADVSEVLSQLGGFVGRVSGDIDEFTKLAHHLQDEITQARMVSIGNLYARLSRTARHAANACEKDVELVLEGASTQLDNSIVQHIADPLIHLVRNAIAHGVEDVAERERAGKPARARVTVRAFHRGNHVFIEVEDDGRGLDYAKIRRAAVEAGFVPAAAAEQFGERELRALLFQPGFTTAPLMTEIAGRGVGLDVVQNNVHALNGEIEIRSETGKGSCFVVKVPLTLIISQALFVRLGTTVLAMPLSVVEEIRRIRPEEIDDVGGKLLTKVRGVVTEVVRLDSALALPTIEPINGFYRMVVMRLAGRQVGVVVEEVLGKDEVVIKNLGEYLKRVRLFPGATISTDGSLILLIDVNRLVAQDTVERGVVTPTLGAARVFAPGAAAVASGSIPAAAMDEFRGEKVVVVADDSISVRKFVGRMLEKAGYRVKLASDGLEASELIGQLGCHLLISDIEMPRMNGYELMTQLRQDPATRRIPVLIVTSRAGAKHRERAMKSGAVAFLTKPVQEDQLLAVVAELIGSPADSEGLLAPAAGRE